MPKFVVTARIEIFRAIEVEAEDYNKAVDIACSERDGEWAAAPNIVYEREITDVIEGEI